MAYASVTDVERRLPSLGAFSTTTKPTLAAVTQWLVEGDAMLDGALASAGLTSPNTDTNGLEILKAWNVDFAEGRVRMSIAAAGGDGSNDDGKDLITGFHARLEEIMNEPAMYGAMLQSGATSAEAVFVRGPSTLDDSGNTINPIIANDNSVDDLGGQF